MAELQFYSCYLSQPSRAIEMLLAATGMKHENKVIYMPKGEHRTPEFKSISPFGTIPYMVHNGFHIPESVAILKYLCAAYKVDDHWYPADLQKKTLIDAYMAWQHLTLRRHGSVLFLNEAYPVLRNKEFGQDEAVNMARSEIKKALTQIEDIFLKDTPFIYSQSLSIADLLCVSEILQVLSVGFNYSESHPKVYEYLRRVRQEFGEEAFDTVHKPIFTFGKGAYIA